VLEGEKQRKKDEDAERARQAQVDKEQRTAKKQQDKRDNEERKDNKKAERGAKKRKMEDEAKEQKEQCLCGNTDQQLQDLGHFGFWECCPAPALPHLSRLCV